MQQDFGILVYKIIYFETKWGTGYHIKQSEKKTGFQQRLDGDLDLHKKQINTQVMQQIKYVL